MSDGVASSCTAAWQPVCCIIMYSSMATCVLPQVCVGCDSRLPHCAWPLAATGSWRASCILPGDGAWYTQAGKGSAIASLGLFSWSLYSFKTVRKQKHEVSEVSSSASVPRPLPVFPNLQIPCDMRVRVSSSATPANEHKYAGKA